VTASWSSNRITDTNLQQIRGPLHLSLFRSTYVSSFTRQVVAPIIPQSTITHSISLTHSPISLNFWLLTLCFSLHFPMVLVTTHKLPTWLRIIQSESLSDRFPQSIMGRYHFHHINISNKVAWASEGSIHYGACNT